MQKLVLAVMLTCSGHICLAQEDQADTATLKFTPPIINKSTELLKNENNQEKVKFAPPVIVKNKTGKEKKPAKNKVKFNPPVITRKTINHDGESQRSAFT